MNGPVASGSKFELRRDGDGLACLTLNPDTRWEVGDHHELVAACDEVRSQGERLFLLMPLEHLIGASSAARQLGATEGLPSRVGAMAFCGGNAIGVMVVNTWIKLSRPPMAVRVFGTVDAGRAWLRHLRG